mgnify:CR=1 FL=1
MQQPPTTCQLYKYNPSFYLVKKESAAYFATEFLDGELDGDYVSWLNYHDIHDKESIENEFGGALEWNELPDGKESYVTVTKEKADFRNENDWNNQFIWLAERLEKLDTTFRKRVRKVDLE